MTQERPRFAAGDISRLVDPNAVEFIGYRGVEVGNTGPGNESPGARKIYARFVTGRDVEDIVSFLHNGGKEFISSHKEEIEVLDSRFLYEVEFEQLDLSCGLLILQQSLQGGNLYLANAQLEIPNGFIKDAGHRRIGYGDLYREKAQPSS